MTQKVKVIIGIAIFVVIIVGASVAYNTLSKRVKPEDNVALVTEEPEEDADVTNGATENANVPEDEEESSSESKALDFTMEDQEGNMVTLSEILANGKPIVLNFWASWCPPCMSEMPDFDAVYKELGDEVQFMMVDMTDGERETVETGTKYIEEQGFSFPVFFDINYEGAINYQIRAIPTTIFIDKEGYIVTDVQGAIDEASLRKNIDMIK